MGNIVTDPLRDRIAAAIERERNQWAGGDAASETLAEAVIAALQDDGWTPPGVAVFTDTYVGDGRGSYASNFCRGGCDCSCCYGMADEPCHCRDAVCNCGGDRAAHGQKPLPVEDDPYEAKADAARQEWADDKENEE